MERGRRSLSVLTEGAMWLIYKQYLLHLHINGRLFENISIMKIDLFNVLVLTRALIGYTYIQGLYCDSLGFLNGNHNSQKFKTLISKSGFHSLF